MLSEARAYVLHINGMDTGFYVSMKEALLADEWNIITFQQASGSSGKYDSYTPYLKELSEYAKKHAPAAKQYIHAIWGWSDAKCAAAGYETSDEMFAAADVAYKGRRARYRQTGTYPRALSCRSFIRKSAMMRTETVITQASA